MFLKELKLVVNSVEIPPIKSFTYEFAFVKVYKAPIQIILENKSADE